jgi:hypothetical protein
MSIFIICALLFARYYYGDQIKEDEKGGACSMLGSDKKYIKNFGRRTRSEETTWKTLKGG